MAKIFTWCLITYMSEPREIGEECSTGSREQQVQGYLLFHRYSTAAKQLRDA